MDEADVDALAERLGVGERQLRRLFRQHLGASPIAVAQTRRVLLAKQLIHETALPMAEVAMASGFGSVRRFNETFQKLYDRPPSALRAASKPEQSAAGAVTLRLSYRPPYDWDAMLAFLALRAIPGVETVEDGVYARTIAIGGARGTDQRRARRRTTSWRYGALPRLNALPAIIARVRRVFDLAADPVAIGAHLSQDPALAPLVAARPACACRAHGTASSSRSAPMLGQQITVVAATRAGRHAGRRAYGARCRRPVRTSRPDPCLPDRRTASRRRRSRRACACPARAPRRCRRWPHAVARRPGSVRPRAAAWRRRSPPLRGLAGIGEWTAQYIAMRQLREPDAFPAADIGLMRAMADADGTRPSARPCWPAPSLAALARLCRPASLGLGSHPVKGAKPARRTLKEKLDADRQAA